jgi:hypothetical protein
MENFKKKISAGNDLHNLPRKSKKHKINNFFVRHCQNLRIFSYVNGF